MTEADDPMASWRDANIPELMPQFRALRDFLVNNPTQHGITDPEHREVLLNELYIRARDAGPEIVQTLRDMFGRNA